MKYLSAILRFMNENEYTHREGIAVKLSETFEENPNINLGDFKSYVKGIRSDFFRINRIDRNVFSESIYTTLQRVKRETTEKKTSYDIVKEFILNSLEIGYNKTKFTEERKNIIIKFGSVKNPHSKLMEAFEQLLQKIDKSFQVSLHGTKEYSGIDISKKIQDAIVGFQIKSVYDDISEDRIRSQTSKALEYGINGFVWVYGRPSSKDVESSIQASYHHFTRINETRKMYCTLIHPELLAELFRRYKINL